VISVLGVSGLALALLSRRYKEMAVGAGPMSLPKARISANYLIVKRNIAMHCYAF